MLDTLAKRYGRRPSEFVGELTELQAISVDMAALAQGVQAERRAQAEAERRARNNRG